ncbi:MAG: DUF1674 domain-containing protein [Magnetovibrio sp.]|nr:DUF1674 domain-containing protein [Magnetovibrio sp.]
MQKKDAAEGPLNSSDTDNSCVTNTSSKPSELPKEIGGRDGPDPTRYGDWENKGRCVDF